MANRNWTLIGFYGLLCILALLAIHDHVSKFACEAGNLKAASKEQNVVVFSCIEFWLNRYQSLLGNIITALVAGLTLYSLIKQIRISQKQSAAVAVDALRKLADEISTKRFDFEYKFGDLQKRSNAYKRLDTRSDPVKTLRALESLIKEDTPILRQIVEDYGKLQDRQQVGNQNVQTKSIIQHLSEGITNLNMMNHSIHQIDWNMKNDGPLDGFAMMNDRFHNLIGMANTAGDCFERASIASFSAAHYAKAEEQQVWIMIRESERMAVAKD